MDDQDYAAKYDRPYNGDKLWRMGKQMVDARHIADKSGGTLSVGAGLGPNSGGIGGELGVVQYRSPWASTNFGFNGMLAGAGDEGGALLGIRGGARIQTPTRLAPFTGIGFYGGIGSESDDCNCGRKEAVGMAAVYPEAGLQFWCSGRVGLSVSSQYWMPTNGRDSDFWFHGITVTVLEDTREGVPRDIGEPQSIRIDPPNFRASAQDTFDSLEPPLNASPMGVDPGDENASTDPGWASLYETPPLDQDTYPLVLTPMPTDSPEPTAQHRLERSPKRCGAGEFKPSCPIAQ